MKFIASRAFRLRQGQVWRDLEKEGQLVVTSHGQPVALLIFVTGENLEETLATVRAAGLGRLVRNVQEESVRKGTDKLTMQEIDEEIRRSRQERK